MSNNIKLKIFEELQNKLMNDKKFAQQFYNDIMESMFKYSKWANIKDVKLEDSCKFQIK